MTPFVLFVLLVTTSPRPATWTAEFTSAEACQSAGDALKARLAAEGRITFVCAKK
jgi:hypothetical protein